LRVRQNAEDTSADDDTSAHCGISDQVRTILKNYSIEKMFIDIQLANSKFSHISDSYSDNIGLMNNQDANIQSL